MKLFIIFITILFIGLGCSNSENKKQETEKLSQETTNSEELDTDVNIHQKHQSLQNDFAHKNIIILENKYSDNETSINQIKEVIKSYLKLKDSFFDGDVNKIDANITNMQTKSDSVDLSLLNEDGKRAWEQHYNLYSDKLKETKHIKGIDGKRSYFSHISEIVYCTVKSFDLKGMELYTIYCPMAFDKKGAYWVNENKQIQNPYFGNEMPDCGKIEEIL
jgi:uncharacterized protein DUF3347